MHFQTLAAATALVLFAGDAIAHPGHDMAEEVAERRSFLGSVRRSSLGHCAEKIKARGLEAKNVARRNARVEAARVKRGISKRDYATTLAISHNETSLGYTPNTDASTLFSSYSSCVLTPDVSQGPYYVGGEYIRRDITDSQQGVDLVLDYQIFDVNTCEPLPSVYVEIWHCNSTGVYSGVVVSGNGDDSDETNIDKTFLRGIQLSDKDGVVEFDSIFPGHYTGRATHIHVITHADASLYKNNTLGNDVYTSHIGQAFFDQSLINEVESTAPYNTNTQTLTENAVDAIMSEEADSIDPVMQYALLGDSVSDGIFAWLAVGINSTVKTGSEISPAAFYYKSGGKSNPNSLYATLTYNGSAWVVYNGSAWILGRSLTSAAARIATGLPVAIQACLLVVPALLLRALL